ncbi:carbonic anhydrase [Azonexus hydrophilus]|uniref:carbonic anhydrase n=1 Tax=Azonexus hydrophilus TaxID=418702 RepID=A0ABZ2XJX1_9RHOO|nr:carbonic anhydrase family protein [Azonexus hydrophilus]
MRLMTIAIALATLPWVATAAPSWQNISAESGRRIELDRSTLKRTGNVVEAQSRVTLDRELIDNRTGTPYKIIEAITRYDCSTRSARTIKRIYRQTDKDTIREEDIAGAELPVRSGTLDDRVLREVCRPPKEGAAELAEKANEAATQLQQANEALLKKELAKTEKPPAVKTAETSSSAPLPSIRPNLKAAMEGKPAAEQQAPAPVEAPPPAASKAPPTINVPSGTTQVVRNNAPAPRPTPRPAAKAPAPAQGGYMLELVRAEPATKPPVKWSYEGAGAPENWARIDPRNALCASGQRQSPIDIRDGIKVDLEPIRFDYRASTFRIVDDGHSVNVTVGDSSFSLTGKTYDLEQIVFRRPGETRVNGQRYEMSAQLMHRATDGSQAVVEILFERGTEHPQIQTLWNHLPLEKQAPVQPPKAVLEPARLLPESGHYYTFMGSLSTPPCTEGVLWIVMKQPIQVSDDQVRIFSRLYRNNARPVQATGDRLIKESR